MSDCTSVVAKNAFTNMAGIGSSPYSDRMNGHAHIAEICAHLGRSAQFTSARTSVVESYSNGYVIRSHSLEWN